MSNVLNNKKLTIRLIQLGGYNMKRSNFVLCMMLMCFGMQFAFKLLSGELTGNNRAAIVVNTSDMEIFKWTKKEEMKHV